MHSRKLSVRSRRAIRERMTPEQRQAEDRAKLIFLNDFRHRHGLQEISMQEASGVA
ncbi:MAG: hypothetical protein ACYDHX_07970 [Methanothrix sp.]